MPQKPVGKALSDWTIYRWMSTIHGPKSARLAMGLVQAEFGAMLHSAHPCPKYKDHPFRKQTVSNHETGKWALDRDMREAYRRVIERHIRQHCFKPIISVEVRGAQQWRIVVKRTCEKCGRHYIIQSSKNVCGRHA